MISSRKSLSVVVVGRLEGCSIPEYPGELLRAPLRGAKLGQNHLVRDSH